jgi:DNA primase
MTSYDSAREEIKRTADIVELIGQYVQLRKAGQNHVGLCPFHAEKEPSFTVSPERHTFHCFGCKKGGDVFSFWMEYHGATFPEALRDLAERYNVTISEGFSRTEEKEKSRKREEIYRINETAAVYFQKSLKDPVKGKAARDYFRKRSIPEEIISEFRLGYAPDGWGGLVDTLRGRNMDLGGAVEAGVIIPGKKGGHYDRFRGRVIFPIFDLRRGEKVVGFGGRVLDESLPKYLNTPETPIFHKGKSLYGLHSSHSAMRETGRAVVVEGYMDFLALRGHGLGEVVATLGTALTSDHIRKIKGIAGEAVIVFDPDEAGVSAVLKSLPVFLNEGLSARAVELPGGHDPDSFVNTEGLDRFRELLDRAPFMFDYYLEKRLARGKGDVEGKVQALKEILPVLSALRSAAQRSLYIRRMAERIGVREEALLSELRSFGKKPFQKGAGRDLKERGLSQAAGKNYGDLQLLNLLVHHPDVVSRLIECGSTILISDPTVTQIVETFFQKHRENISLSPENLENSFESEAARIKLREVLVGRSFYLAGEVEQAVREIERKAYQRRLSESLKMAKGDIETLNKLLKLKAQGPVGSERETQGRGR